MKGRLVKLANELYLTLANFDIMAKDLKPDTLVFCHSEIHMNDESECVRHSSTGDNCFACQPLVASTKQIEGALKLSHSTLLEVMDLKDGDSRDVVYYKVDVSGLVLIIKEIEK